MSCKISHWLDQLNISQDKKEELFAHELDAWDQMAKSKLFVRKGDKILMPKNEYGKAVSIIAKINKSLPSPIIRITKQEIGEVVKVNATPLVEIVPIELRETSKVTQVIKSKTELQTILKEEINDTKQTRLDDSELTRVLWGTLTGNVETGFIFKNTSNVRGNLPDIHTLQDRINKRTFNEVWNSGEFSDLERRTILLHSFQQRLSDRTSFNGKLFEKINRELGVLDTHIVEAESPLFVYDKQLYLDIDKFYQYLVKNPVEDVSKYLDFAIAEELIHVVTMYKVPFNEMVDIITTEISNPSFYTSLLKVYRSLPVGKYDIAFREYVRMVVQQEVLGTTTEQVKFTNQGIVNKIIKAAWDFIKEFFVDRPKLSGIIQRHIDFIQSNQSQPYIKDELVSVEQETKVTNNSILKRNVQLLEFRDSDDFRSRILVPLYEYPKQMVPSSSLGEIKSSPLSNRERVDKITNYLIDKLYSNEGWVNSIAQDLAKRGVEVKIGIYEDANYPQMSQMGDMILINKRAIELDLEDYGDTYEFLDRSFEEEFIHVLTYALSSEEDIQNIKKELSPENIQRVKDYYNSEKGGVLNDEQVPYEYIRMVVQKKLFNKTTEDSKQELLSITKTMKKILNEILDYLISFFEQNPESVSSKLIGNIIETIEEESVGNKSLRRYKDLSNEIHNSELKQKQIEHTLPTEVTSELKDTFIDFLKKINPDFKIEILDDLILRRGLNGVVNFKEFIISLQRGKEEKLGEEVVHLLVEMLEKDSPLFLRMNDEITRTRLYKDVVKRYREVYGNDTQRLKKEAMAQLIHLYLVDKENFKKWSGSDSLVENLVKWIKDFFQWLKGNKEISSFILAANKIVNLDTSDLTNKQIPYDEMFSLADERTVEEEFAKKMRVEVKTFHSLGGRQVDKYKKVYININDTIFDTISYQKEHPRIDIWGIHTGDQTNLREYYRTVKLTALGRELKDKIEEIGAENVVFYTEAFINQVLLDRLVDLYGINPNQVKPRKKVDMVDLPDGTSRELESEDIAEEIDDIEGRVLVIDNSRAMIVSKEKVPYSAIKSKYEPLLDKHLQARADAQRKTISENYYAEMERLGIKTFSREIQQTFDLIKREFNNSKALRKKIEAFNSVDLQHFFEDNQGNVGIPIQISLDQKIQVSKDRLELHEREVMNFVRTLESATQYYKYLLQDGLRIVDRLLTEGPEGTRLAIWELNRMTSSARAWQGHIEMMLASIAGKPNTELTKTLYNNLLGAIKELNDLATKKATEAISERLIPIFEGYDYGKKALIKDFEEKRDSTTFEYSLPLGGKATRTTTNEDRIEFQRQIDEIEKNGVTKERITRILLGEETDINPLTVWIKTLMNSSNPLMAGLNIMMGKDKWEADAATIRQTQDVIFEIEELRKKTGLSDDKFFEEITQIGKARVWNKEKDAYEWVDRLELLNPYQNRHILDQKMEEVEKIHERYNKATGEEKEELRALWLSERDKFERWKHENFYDDYLQEYYFRFDPLKAEYGELLDEALELYRSYSSEIRRLGDELNQADFQDQKRIHHQILLQVSEQRRLKSQYNQDGTLKDEKGQKVAEILQKRTEIDKKYHEFEVNHDKFKRDFLAVVNSEGLDNTEIQNINLHLFTKEYAKLYDYIKELKNTELLSWLDLHLKTVYSQEFYDTRTVITQTLTSLINQLNEAYGEGEVSNMDELWQEIQGLTTTYRDEDGYLDGSIMNDETQIKVKELEEQIERIKELTRAERIGKTSKQIKGLKKAISEEIEKLKELQSKETTDSYEETFQDMAVNTKLDEFIEFGYNTPTDSFINSPEFLVFLQEHPDHPFVTWFKRNHLEKQRFISDGITGAWEFYWSPTYVWMKIEPNNKAYIQAQPSFGYTERVVLSGKERNGVKTENYHTPKGSTTYLEHSDTWLPFSDEFISDRWKAFIRRNDSQGRTLQELRDKLEKFHFESQNGDISDSKIDWFLPSVQRNTLEAPSIKSMYKDFLDKTNRFEEGEGNPDEAQMGNRGFKDRMKAFFHQGFLNIHKHFTEDAGDPRNKIPVPYAYHMEPKDISKDVIAGIMLYRGGTLAANNFLESIPTLNLAIRVLEDNTNPYMRDLEENYDEKGNLKKKEERTRLVEGAEFTRSKAFGRNKVYEMGVGADRFLALVRKINTMGSLSDLTGWANNLKNNFAGRVQNLINADFANWSSARSMQKATWYKKNNFFWFLNQSDKKVKEVDWHIMAYFNPTLTNEMVQLTLPGATKRFLKTHINSWSSHILEFSVSSNTLYAHLFDKKVERHTTTGKEVKSLHEILTIKNNGLSVQEGWIDSRTKRPINDDYLLDTRKSFISVLEYINGKVSDKTFLSTTTMGSSILYFKNWLIPMLRRRFDSKKANYALEEDIEGYWNTFGKFIWQFARHQKNVYPTLSPMEQANINSAVKEMLVILASSALVAFAFGFDYDDKDKFKKLRQKTYAERLALLLLIQTQAETESLSMFGFGGVGGSNFIPPAFQEGYRFLKSPLIGLGSIDNLLKALQYTWGLPQYGKDMPLFNIEKEEYKSLHYAGKVIQLDDFQYTYDNPEGRLFGILSILRR